IMGLNRADQIGAVRHDPVQRQNRQARRKARDRRRQAEDGGQAIEGRPVAEPPFVKIAEKDSRLLIARTEQVDNHPGLLMAGTMQKAEMSRDYPQRIAALEFQFGDQSAPWFEPRKFHLMDIAHQAFAKENDIAMPAMGL